VSSGAQRYSWSGPEVWQDLRATPDGSKLVAASANKAIRVFDVESKKKETYGELVV